MHAIFMVRGINQNFELWRKFMETQMFTWKRQPLLKDEKGNLIKNEDGTYKRGPEEFTLVQGSLRPIQLFEYVFPQESLQEVLAMQGLHTSYDNPRSEVKSYAWLLRKMMKLKPAPDMPDLKKKDVWEVTRKYVPMLGVAAYLVGIKEDVIQDFPDYGYYQEGL